MAQGGVFYYGFHLINQEIGRLSPPDSASIGRCPSMMDEYLLKFMVPIMVFMFLASSIGMTASMATDTKMVKHAPHCLITSSPLPLHSLSIFRAPHVGERSHRHQEHKDQPPLPSLQAKRAALEFFGRMERRSCIDPLSNQGTTMPSVRGGVELRDVQFAYPTRPQVKVCDGYSLRVEPGQVVALCGPSGSGKSTVIALLERFYDPQQGQVLLDGVDIRTLNVRWLREQLGLVAQEPVLFTGTVAENIEYGKEGATRDEVIAAARMADAHDFITQVGLSLRTSSQKKASLPFGNEPAPLYAPVLCARFTHQHPPHCRAETRPWLQHRCGEPWCSALGRSKAADRHRARPGASTRSAIAR
jgi:ABC-type multidrug transport system fused ATPase/permease subunit